MPPSLKFSAILSNYMLGCEFELYTMPNMYNFVCTSRIITLPSVRYSGRVEVDIIESRLGWGETDHEPVCCENNN